MDIQHYIDNPSKGETYDDTEKTVANQMARFTHAMTDSKDTVESLKLVCALGFDLMKICGLKVCEDTNFILAHIIRKQSVELAGQFQQIALNSNNNDICIYLYLALPTINNNVSRKSLVALCEDTIDKMAEAYTEINEGRVGFFKTNTNTFSPEKIKEMYHEYLNNFN